MTPKKPSQSAKRSAWLASLKPGDSVYLWQSWYGWCQAPMHAGDEQASQGGAAMTSRWQRDALISDLLSQGFAVSERDITVRIGGPGELIIECRAELVEPIRRAAHDRFPVGTLLTFKESQP